jgi:PPE-SVP subfamily C-terminal region
MYGYAGSSAAATKLSPFMPPPPTTINPTHLAAPATTIGQLDNTSAGSNSQTVLSTASQLHSAMTNVLHTFASPTPSSASPPSVSSSAVPLTSPDMPGMNPSAAAMSTLKLTMASISAGSVASKQGLALGRAVSVRDWFVGGSRNSWSHRLTRTTGKPEASRASADTVGVLSVPQTWKATAANPTSAAVLPWTRRSVAPKFPQYGPSVRNVPPKHA